MGLTIINKIINNCKTKSTFVSQDNDREYEFWDIRVLKDKEFKQYIVIHYFEDDEDYKKESWSIFEEDGTDICCDYHFATEFEDENYGFAEWLDEYKDTLEDNQSVIELVEKYNNCNFEV